MNLSAADCLARLLPAVLGWIIRLSLHGCKNAVMPCVQRLCPSHVDIVASLRSSYRGMMVGCRPLVKDCPAFDESGRPFAHSNLPHGIWKSSGKLPGIAFCHRRKFSLWWRDRRRRFSGDYRSFTIAATLTVRGVRSTISGKEDPDRWCMDLVVGVQER